LGEFIPTKRIEPGNGAKLIISRVIGNQQKAQDQIYCLIKYFPVAFTATPEKLQDYH